MPIKSTPGELFYLRETIRQLSKKYHLEEDDLLEYTKQPQNILVPVTLFSDRKLGVLEVMVEYLKDHEHLTFHQIAVVLKRDDRTIWTAYHQAKRKRNNVPG